MRIDGVRVAASHAWDRPRADNRLAESARRRPGLRHIAEYTLVGAGLCLAGAAATFAWRSAQSTTPQLPGLAAIRRGHPWATPSPQLPLPWPEGSQLTCIEQAGAPPCAPAIVPERPLSAYLAVCLLIRDDPDFPEWLAHHRRLGVGAFYIFDHNSTVALPRQVPDGSLHRGDVHYQYFNTFSKSNDSSAQMAAYHQCLQLGQHHPWMGFIDADEYLVPARGYIFLPDFLRRFEGQCALAVNWRTFGSSKQRQRPKDGVLKSYTKCFPPHHYFDWRTKVIANPQRVIDFQYLNGDGRRGPHTVQCQDGSFMVNEDGERYATPDVHPSKTEKLVLHHYVTRSHADYVRRMARDAGSTASRDWSFFNETNRLATDDCIAGRELARWLG